MVILSVRPSVCLSVLVLFRKFLVFQSHVNTTEKLLISACCLGSMPRPVCNRSHERLANNGKITTFTRLLFFDALVRRFPWT